jgi:signal transduction histidine kinase
MARHALDLIGTDGAVRSSSPRVSPLGMRGGLGKTLLIAFLLLAITPLSLLALLTYNRIQHDAKQELVAALDTRVTLKEAHLLDWIEGYERELAFWATVLEGTVTAPGQGTDGTTSREASLAPLLQSASDTGSSLTGWVLLDRNTGSAIASAGVAAADVSVLQPLLAGDQRLVIAPPPDASALPLAAVGYTRGDQRLVGLLSWGSLQQLITASDSPEQGLSTYLVTKDGLVVSDQGLEHLPPDRSAIPSRGVLLALEGQKASGSFTNLEGLPVFGAYHWDQDLGVALVAEQSQNRALARGNALTAVVVGATLVVALITTVIAALVTRRITRPIVQLTETAAWMARGDLEQRVSIVRQDEIGVLAQAFNRMAAELSVLYADLEGKVAERTQQLQDANRRTSYYAMQLALSAEVARVATSIRDVDVLLTTVARLIEEAFELAHVSIYLQSGDGRAAAPGRGAWSVWQASREALPALSESVAIEDVPLVGQVAADSQRRLVRRSRQGLSKPQPTVECEMAVPLQVQGRLLGVIDLQSSRAKDFGGNDQMIYQSLADQISIAIENARAYAAERVTVQRLQELDRIQSEFLTSMSHALRTPLNSIIGFSRVMLKELDGPLTDLQRTDLTTVYDSGRHLLGLVNDMLELTQLDLGTAPFFVAPVDLGELIEGVMATVQALARNKAIQLQAQVPETLPVLHTDGQRVRQVILALLSNAVKYTDQGSVRLRVASDHNDGRVTISVSDTGDGAARREEARLFAEAGPGPSDDEANLPAFGLAVSRRVAEKLGGEIWLESEEGTGSTFFFALPLRGKGTVPRL